MSDKSEESNRYWGISGVFIPAGLFIGMGVGWAMDHLVQGMFIGLLVLCILGDEALLSGWDELPEVVATLMFDGPRPQAEEAAE